MSTLTTPPDSVIESVLRNTRKIGLLGASDKPNRPSYEVMEFLLHQGYEVIPVNPRLEGASILGQTVVASIDQLPDDVDMLELFLNPNRVGNEQDALLEHPAPIIWMQVGVIHEEVAEAARELGKTVIMDRCPKREIPRLGLLKD